MQAIVLLCMCLLPLVLGYGEPDSSGNPDWFGYASVHVTNLVRVDPTNYKAIYMAGYSPSPANILTPAVFPPVPPLYMDYDLMDSSEAHSKDLAVNSPGCPFQHNSCNGTGVFTRILSYYTCGWSSIGENIAAGNYDPIASNNQYVCDSTTINGQSVCAPDNKSSEADGHRSNIMSSGYDVVGGGHYYTSTSTYGHYWTSDFIGGGHCNPPSQPANTIPSGTHLYNGNTITFTAVSTATSLSPLQVVVDGTAHALTLQMGVTGRGVYTYSATKQSKCQQYYFQIGTSRFPDTGCLVTNDMYYPNGNTCTQSFVSTCAGTPAPTSTPPPPTTKPPTTKPTSKPTSAPTGPPGTYYLYTTNSLQNGWSDYGNSPVKLTNGVLYNGVYGLQASVQASGTNQEWFWFSHSTLSRGSYTQVKFNAAAPNSMTLAVYFNGGYVNSFTLTSTWQSFSILITNMLPSSTTNFPQLIFSNSNSSPETFYLNDVAFA